MFDPPGDPQRLAIVVPAWKPLFLREALSSIATQTCRDFDCYLFDDAGPAELLEIAAEFREVRCFRFDENLGGTSLVAHLNRCLRLVGHRWVWLFSDDDVMSPNSVAAFYAARARFPEVKVFQLPVEMVSENLGQVLWRSFPPQWEPASSFQTARFRGERLSCLPDHIFCWEDLRSKGGGLVDFPLAWNSDDATWLLLGRGNGLACVEGAMVKWRRSGLNVSHRCDNNREKLKADIEYLRWLEAHQLLPQKWSDIIRYLSGRIVNLYGFAGRDFGMLWKMMPAQWKMSVPLAMLNRAGMHVRRLIASRPMVKPS